MLACIMFKRAYIGFPTSHQTSGRYLYMLSSQNESSDNQKVQHSSGMFYIDGVFLNDTLPSSNFEIPLASGSRSLSRESRLSLLSKFYDYMAALRYGEYTWAKYKSFHLTGEYYETGFTYYGCIQIRNYSDEPFKTVTQVPLRLGSNIKEGRMRFRWKLYRGGETLSRLKGYNR